MKNVTNTQPLSKNENNRVNMPKLLNPCIDPIFKAMMTDNSPEGRKALTSFISTVIGHSISDIELLPNELPNQNDTDKQSVFDLTCVIDGKEKANIEMQGVNIFNAYNNRVEYHVSHLMQYSVPKGLNWDKVEKVFQISVLNFIYSDFTKHKNVLTHFMMQSDDGVHLGDRMNVFFIELPKIEQQNISIKDMTSVERWAKYFRNAADESKQDLIQELTKYEEGIMDAQAVLNRISTNDAMWVQQKHYYDAIARENTIISENYEKGLNKGLAQGRSEGIALGRAEGSHAKAIETAHNLIKFGMSIAQISEATGLTITEIKQLR